MNQGSIGSGCFGKRPPAADYIHHHRGGPAILEWQRWVQDGVDRASGRFGAAVEPLLRDLRVFGFAYPSARSDVYLIGAIGPGRDRSGRLFPFTVFAEVVADASGSVPDSIFRHEHVWRRAAEIVASEETDLAALFAAVDGLASGNPSAPNGEQSVAEFLARETVGTFTSGDDQEAMRLALARVARNLRRVALRVVRDRCPPAYGLRFPLPHEAPRATAARAVFLEMSLRLLGPKQRPALFWTSDARRGYLDVHLGPVGPEAFLPLLNPSVVSDEVFVMDEETAGTDGGDPGDDAPEACWAEPGLSLQEAADRCGPANGRRRS